MRNDPSKQMKVKDLIALCHIIDDYEEFIKKLENFMANENNMINIHKLGIVSRGEFCFGSRKFKRFYKQNKNVIDKINEYSGISSFIFSNCYSNGDTLDYFYKYIISNKEKLNEILILLDKIRELDINEIELNESFDFTSDEYIAEDIVTLFPQNFNIPYYDNIEIIPNYDEFNINYKTTGSDYMMMIRPSRISCDGSCNVDQIKVRSLLFDPAILPETITQETTFDKILELKKLQKEKCEIIKKSVNLSIGVEGLENQFSFTRVVLEQLADQKNNPELIEILTQIKENIERLQIIEDKHNRDVSKENDFITIELIEKEKVKQLQNLEKSRIHSSW